MVVVPSPEMGEWVKQGIAEQKEICLGVEIFYLNTALTALIEQLFHSPSQKKIPSRQELSFALLKEIYRLSQEDHPFASPVKRYLEGREEKKIELALTLAKLFERYALYAPEATSQWERNPVNWQELLWQRVFAQEWTHLGAVIPHLKAKKEIPDLRVALFSFSHLPKLAWHLFDQVAKKVPIGLYHLSPSKEFWSDFLSAKEQKRMEGLDRYIEDQHPFLANLGKVGREFAKLVEESSWEPQEIYLSPKKQTALVQFQQGLLHLDQKKILWDMSLQLHIVNTKKREVDVLFSSLKQALVNREILPSDVIVMAPDITPYVPFIRALFEGEIPYRISDMESNFTEGVFKLLNIQQERWSSTALLDLFSDPLFLQKQGWTHSDLYQIERLMQEYGVKWGIDQAHRQDLLPQSQLSGGGTWMSALAQLFDAYTTGDLSYTTCDLVEQVYELLKDLKSFLDAVQKETLYMHEWREKVELITKRMFGEDTRMLEALDSLCKGALHSDPLPFSFLLILIKEELKQKRLKWGAHHLEAVSFSSFLPMRTIPAKWIWIMGLEEASFPRTEHRHPLDRLPHVKSTYCPSCVDYDRYLFLEAVLSCREKFCMSYAGLEEGEKLPPSSVVADFCRHFDAVKEQEHLPRSYDPCYFEEQAQFLSAIESDFICAKALIEPPNEKQPSLERVLSEKKVFFVKELDRFARSPLRFFLEENQGLHFFEKKSVQKDEIFLLSAIQKWKVNHEMRSHSITQIKSQMKARGEYPEGNFEKIADLSIESQKALECIEISLDESPLYVSTKRGQIEIRGVLHSLSTEGVVVWGNRSFTSVAKVWPLYLLFRCHLQKELPIYFEKDGKSYSPSIECPQNALRNYLEVVLDGRENALYLYPDWIIPIIKEDEIALRRLWKAPIHEPALQWMGRGKHMPSYNELIQSTQKIAQTIFSEVINDWL